MDPVLTSCKVTAVSNPITFESGLIYLADYSAKRLIRPKKKQTDQQLQSDADLPSPEIQFVDEFASPFSWFPKNGFTAYKITCEGPRSSVEVEGDKNKNEEKSNEQEDGKEESKSKIVKLSDIKKSVLESAKQRKLDPVSMENVKRAPKPIPQVQSVSPNKIEIRELLEQSSSLPQPSASMQSVPGQSSSSIQSSSNAIPQSQNVENTNPQRASSVNQPSTPSLQVSQNQCFSKKVNNDTGGGFQLHKPSSLTNCASVSTLNSEIAEEKVSSNDKLGEGSSTTEEEIPLTRGESDAKPSDVTISEEFGVKMGTASSYEFLLDW